MNCSLCHRSLDSEEYRHIKRSKDGKNFHPDCFIKIRDIPCAIKDIERLIENLKRFQEENPEWKFQALYS